MEQADMIAPPSREGRRPHSRRGCLLFIAGLAVGAVGLPLLLWLVLLLADGAQPLLDPGLPAPGRPDVTVALSRAYIQRSAERLALGSSAAPALHDPRIDLAPHPRSGARITVTGRMDLPFVNPGVRATFQLAAVEGRLHAATEQLALGSGGEIPLPVQSVAREWLDELINDEVQSRIRSTSNTEIHVVHVGANREQLIVQARLREQ